MAAKGKVNIIWQIIFVAIVPFGYVWAFYKIEKIKKMILYVELPSIALVILLDVIIISSGFPITEEEAEIFTEPGPEFIPGLIVSFAGFSIIVGFAIYLIYKWSVEWNKKFDNIESTV